MTQQAAPDPSPARPGTELDPQKSSQPTHEVGAVSTMRETTGLEVAGVAAIVVALVGLAVVILGLRLEVVEGGGFLGIIIAVLGVIALTGVTIVSPGQTKVVQFLGHYVGTVRRSGLVWTYPITTRRTVSVRVRNFETSELKVNDADGNPINIAAIVVWQVADTARARFGVENFEEFVEVQSEAALRHVARSHPYDAPDDHEGLTLQGATEQISAEIEDEVSARVAVAGVTVVEARISSLAYAPEIAQAMLQRQQAGAIIAARSRIVEGAVSMVEQALARLEDENVVALDEERKANMVSNLLVVLCGESRPTPVVNAGSLYA